MTTKVSPKKSPKRSLHNNYHIIVPKWNSNLGPMSLLYLNLQSLISPLGHHSRFTKTDAITSKCFGLGLRLYRIDSWHEGPI